VIQEIQSRPEVPKEAAKMFKKKLSLKDPKAIMLTLELLDQAMVQCGLPMHQQVAQKEFMNALIILIN